MNFNNEFYEADVKENLFQSDTQNQRVTFPAFINWVDEKSVHQYVPNEFQHELTIFDDDRDGTALYEDMVRVMRIHGQCPDEEIASFLVRAEHGPNPEKS